MGNGPVERLGEQAHQEDHAVGDPAGQIQRFRPAGGDEHRQVGAGREAQMRAAEAELPPAQVPRAQVLSAQVLSVQVNGLAAPERPDPGDRGLHGGQAARPQAQRQQRAVARADAEDHPAAGDLVNSGGGRRGDGRMAGGRIGHGRADQQPRAAGRGQGEVGVAVAGVQR